MTLTPPFKRDDRIRLTSMGDDPCPVQAGTTGTVTSCSLFQSRWNVGVKWDNGRTLSLVVPPDNAELIQ